jgi:cytochrome c553
VNQSYTAAEKRHLERIKSMPCIVCQAPAPSQAHHVKQDSAYHCVPLCQSCHQDQQNGIHGRKAMWKIHKMDEMDAMALLIKMLVGDM